MSTREISRRTATQLAIALVPPETAGEYYVTEQSRVCAENNATTTDAPYESYTSAAAAFICSGAQVYEAMLQATQEAFELGRAVGRSDAPP